MCAQDALAPVEQPIVDWILLNSIVAPFQVPRLVASPRSLEEALEALSLVEPLTLSHHWPNTRHRKPATVWLGHAAGELAVLAYVPDDAIWSTADGHNQRLWELGDAFEMFFQAEGAQEYFELHVSPANWRLQLRIPSAEEFSLNREHAFEEYLLREGAFTSETAIRDADWVVFASVPKRLVGAKIRSWRFSFCRYDYDGSGREPVLSSTSDHSELDFHRIHEWGMLELQ